MAPFYILPIFTLSSDGSKILLKFLCFLSLKEMSSGFMFWVCGCVKQNGWRFQQVENSPKHHSSISNSDTDFPFWWVDLQFLTSRYWVNGSFLADFSQLVFSFDLPTWKSFLAYKQLLLISRVKSLFVGCLLGCHQPNFSVELLGKNLICFWKLQFWKRMYFIFISNRN